MCNGVKKMVSTDGDTSFHPFHVSLSTAKATTAKATTTKATTAKATTETETDISCSDVMILLLCLSSIGGFIVFIVWIASPRLFGTPS